MRVLNPRKPMTLIVFGLMHGFLAIPAPGVAQTDTTPPELVEFSFTPQAIDTTGSAQTVTVTARLTDDLAGVAHFCTAFFSPSQQQNRGTCLQRVSGTALDGIWEGQIQFPQFGESGVWHLLDFHTNTSDQVGNHRGFQESELAARGFPTTLQVNMTASAGEQLGGIVEDLQAIIDANPGTPLADKIEDALAKVNAALDKLRAGDRQGALGELEGAVGDLQAAVESGLLPAADGTELMDRIAAAARQIAEEAIQDAVDRGANAGKIAEAEQAIADGDAKRAAGQFKAAVAKYKEVLSKAEAA